MRKKTKQLSGGRRLVLSGRSPVLVGFEPDQKEKIDQAAASDGRNVTQFVRYHALMAAEKILEKLAKKS